MGLCVLAPYGLALLQSPRLRAGIAQHRGLLAPGILSGVEEIGRVSKRKLAMEGWSSSYGCGGS